MAKIPQARSVMSAWSGVFLYPTASSVSGMPDGKGVICCLLSVELTMQPKRDMS